MKKVFRAGALSLFVAMASTSVFAADAQDFVDEASAKGFAEVQNGKLAVEKSQSADVKAFAQMMIKDHEAANEKLASLAKTKNLKVADDAELLDKAKSMILEYREESFDKAYAENQVKAHEATIELFEEEAKDGKDAGLKAFAAQTLPKLQAHLKAAKELAGEHAK